MRALVYSQGIRLAIFPLFGPNFKRDSLLIMKTFLVIFCYFLTLRHLNDRDKIIKPEMDKSSAQTLKNQST